MAKSRDAFRTISEVSEALDTPTHVLRFWESKFTQIKPVKRAGGRRYYRPEDIDLLAGIKTLLHDQGLTIKGAQKLMREQGVKHVIALGDTSELGDDTKTEMGEQTNVPAPQAAIEEPAAVNVEPPSLPQIANTQPLSAPKEPEPEPTVADDAPKMPPAPAATPVKGPIAAPPRVAALAAVAEANHVFVDANKAKINPLLQRLETLRNAMNAA